MILQYCVALFKVRYIGNNTDTVEFSRCAAFKNPFRLARRNAIVIRMKINVWSVIVIHHFPHEIIYQIGNI